MKLTVNGEPHEHQGDGKLPSLLKEIDANPKHVSIMINEAIIQHTSYNSVTLSEGDRVEILTFVGGG